MGADDTKVDRVLTHEEEIEFKRTCHIKALEYELQDAHDMLAAYKVKLINLNDYIRLMEKIGAERESKLKQLEKTLDKLELELFKLGMEIESNERD